MNKESILYSDHEALKHLNSQQKISRRHATWSEFLQSYPFILKHKAGVQNTVVDALSRLRSLLSTLQIKVIGFEIIKELYQDDLEFDKVWSATDLRSPKNTTVYKREGFLFKGKALCIPQYSLQEAIIWEAMMEDWQAILGDTKLWPWLSRISICQN